MKETQSFKTLITAKRSLFSFNLYEILQYKDLIGLFVKREFVSKYKQTILGPLWAVIQPLLTTFVFTFVFENLAGLATTDVKDMRIPGFLFYMAGNICWAYFSSTLSSVSSTFIQNSGIMGKVYYPRIITPISTALSNLISFAIQFVMFFVCCIVFSLIGAADIQITPMLLMIPLVVLQMIILSIGLGVIISSVTTKYRDLQMLVGFGLQLWQYASPIAYGLVLISSIKNNFIFNLYMCNPITSIITTFRYAVFGFGYFDLGYYLIGWVTSILIFVLGVILFNKVERTFMDTI